MLSLSKLKSILREHNIRPSKRLGQNFLIDQNIKNKIINSIELDREDVVIEVGPGLGALTEDLCRKAKKVIAVEKDKRLHALLKQRFSFDNLELVNADMLKYKLENFQPKVKVAGNLPYYISSPILNHLIENRSYVDAAYITVQKEFAQRLVARPGTKDYGSLSCYAQFYTEPRIMFNIPKGAFFPMPEVESSFLKIVMRRKKLFDVDEEMLFKIIRSAFEKRRKQIVNSLYSAHIFQSKEKIAEVLERAGIPESARPETIALDGFVNIARKLALILLTHRR